MVNRKAEGIYLIFTLDGANWYYMTPLYLTFILWASMILIRLMQRFVINGKREAIVIGLSAVCAAGILSVSAVSDFHNYCRERGYMLSDFRRVAEEYQRYDCIFVEKNTDNLFQGLWFEFGNYDEFKKISLEDFKRNDISMKELAGRKDSSGLIVYAPMEYVDEEKYQLLACKDGFGVYKMMDEAAK